jgi:hypothetical protein
LLGITAAFLAGQCVSALAMPHVAWQPAPRFVEAATALAVAYLAVEILMLPEAGTRWLVTFVLGLFHGMYFHLFLQTTEYSPALVLAGAAVAEMAAIAVMGLALARVGRIPRQVSAGALLAFGMVWFCLRLRG